MKTVAHYGMRAFGQCDDSPRRNKLALSLNRDIIDAMRGGPSTVVNALIRCTRSDCAAGPVFELVRDDLGLWILELDRRYGRPLRIQIDLIADEIEKNRAKLTDLRMGSEDYTLHLSIHIANSVPLRIPYRLSSLAYECGFEIEILIEEYR